MKRGGRRETTERNFEIQKNIFLCLMHLNYIEHIKLFSSSPLMEWRNKLERLSSGKIFIAGLIKRANAPKTWLL
jgi:hypothetical protein